MSSGFPPEPKISYFKVLHRTELKQYIVSDWPRKVKYVMLEDKVKPNVDRYCCGKSGDGAGKYQFKDEVSSIWQTSVSKQAQRKTRKEAESES